MSATPVVVPSSSSAMAAMTARPTLGSVMASQPAPVTSVAVAPVEVCKPCTPRRPVCAPEVTTTCTKEPRTVYQAQTVYEPKVVYDNVRTTCVTTRTVEPACDPCAKPCAAPCDPCAKPCDPCATYGWGHGFWSFFIIFIVVALIVALILWAVKPNWVMNTDANGNPTGEINAGKLVLASVLIGLVLAFIIWLIWRCTC